MSDIEHQVLAGILPQNTFYLEKAQLRQVTESNFETPAYRELWKYIDAYFDDHMQVIPRLILKEQMLRAGVTPEQAVGLDEIYGILSAVQVTAHEFDASLDILKEDELTKKTSNAVVAAREILQGEYYDEKTDTVLRGQEAARVYLSEQLQDLESVGSEAAPEGDIKDDVEDLWQKYNYLEENPEESSGIPYGIAEVDEVTGGVRPGDLALIAAFTGVGKSHLLASLAWNAMRTGHNLSMFTTETTREVMEIRILARHTRLPKFKCPGGINAHDIMSGTLSSDHKDVFRDALYDFKSEAGKLIMVQMPSSGNVDYVHAKANQYNRKFPLELVLIDSINLLRSSIRYPSKREMLEDLLQDFKRFSSAFDSGRGVGVVSPWQMSRTAWREAVDNGGRYSLASLSDTSESEKSPGQILTLMKGEDVGEPGRVSIQVLKNRIGQEMDKISYPVDYRNSYFGSSAEAGLIAKPQNSQGQMTRDIGSIMRRGN